MRGEARRQAREQIALQMSDMNDSAPDWPRIEPLLDEAMQSLDDTDRTAILLRYFENKSLREVGQALGASEDAAQKRVSRATERLREFLGKRKITVGASGLAALMSAHAVQAAPVGLAATVASGAVLASTTGSVSTALAITNTFAMTTVQKTIIAVVAAGAITVGLYQARQVSHLRIQVKALERQSLEQHAVLSNRLQEVRNERDRATNALAALAAAQAATTRRPNEVLKLRGEVGRLRQENVQMGASSPLSKVTANPEARQLLRDQQKAGMGVIYKGLAQQLKLTPEQTGNLTDLLADHIMTDVDHITAILRDKPTLEYTDRVFNAQDAVLRQEIEELLGAEGLAQYEDYTRSLLATLTTDQFKGQLSGTPEERKAKAEQLRQAIQEASQTALADAGLPSDYQTVPMLNFRNIASEQQQERSVRLLDDIYQRVATRGSQFLSAEDVAKFQEFRATALTNSRTALSLNRTMMAPISD